jgi:membrane peptidoglycan carboxypeptidase
MKLRVRVPVRTFRGPGGRTIAGGAAPPEFPEPPPALDEREVFDAPSRSGRRKTAKGWWILACAAAVLIGLEMKTAWAQSRILAYTARSLHFDMRAGPNPDIQYPQAGPYDARLGHAKLPEFQEHLLNAGFRLEAQARPSKLYRYLANLTRVPIYREKNQAGLRVLDFNGKPLYEARFPQRIYRDFDSIPPMVVSSLLFIENREILDPGTPYRNPAVEWDRLAKAMLDLGIRQVRSGHAVSGGSTLATQLEKVRHSPRGRTDGVTEKFRQMLSASIRAYQDGEETLGARKQIICDYINSVPLSALSGYGEIHGLGDGLYAWFGADFERFNRIMLQPGDRDLAEKALAYRQALSLLLAIRKPSGYLQQDPAGLDERLAAYLPLLVDAGVISTPLMEAVANARPTLAAAYSGAAPAAFVERKTADSLRGSLLSLLGIRSTYDLDRLDLTVSTHLDGATSLAASRKLDELATPEGAARGGILGERMLDMERAGEVIYSFTMYERRGDANLLRIQVDNYKQALNLNEGSRLELGSTAKLRTLVSYLEAVALLHERFRALAPAELQKIPVNPQDSLTQWAIDHLSRSEDTSLTVMLEASMNRVVSAKPDVFYTGGGEQTFANFDGADNARALTVREAFFRSVNLVFVRLLREVVNYHLFRNPNATAILDDPGHPERGRFLAQFADNEGRYFLGRYYRKYRGMTTAQTLRMLSEDTRMTPKRFTVIFRTVKPRGTMEELARYLQAVPASGVIDEDDVESMFKTYAPNKYDLNDLAYLARIHPLEMWLIEYLRDHPEAALEEVIRESAGMRQFVYQWLIKGGKTQAQNLRIKTLMEREAFGEIHESWKRLGYPFAALVPSLGTALGSSGDTPAALSELVGIVLNDGVRVPTTRIDRLHFAQRTPVETVMSRKIAAGERVLPQEVTAVVRDAMTGVVERGTAFGAFRAVTLPNGTALTIGGKTGTGDNRHEVTDGRGNTISSKVLNRTAAFVFFIGDRFYGTIVAYVPGEQAGGQHFTSALPVTVFRNLVPSFRDLVINTAPPAAANLAWKQ